MKKLLSAIFFAMAVLRPDSACAGPMSDALGEFTISAPSTYWGIYGRIVNTDTPTWSEETAHSVTAIGGILSSFGAYDAVNTDVVSQFKAMLPVLGANQTVGSVTTTTAKAITDAITGANGLGTWTHSSAQYLGILGDVTDTGAPTWSTETAHSVTAAAGILGTLGSYTGDSVIARLQTMLPVLGANQTVGSVTTTTAKAITDVITGANGLGTWTHSSAQYLGILGDVTDPGAPTWSTETAHSVTAAAGILGTLGSYTGDSVIARLQTMLPVLGANQTVGSVTTTTAKAITDVITGANGLGTWAAHTSTDYIGILGTITDITEPAWTAGTDAADPVLASQYGILGSLDGAVGNVVTKTATLLNLLGTEEKTPTYKTMDAIADQINTRLGAFNPHVLVSEETEYRFKGILGKIVCSGAPTETDGAVTGLAGALGALDGDAASPSSTLCAAIMRVFNKAIRVCGVEYPYSGGTSLWTYLNACDPDPE